MPFPVAPSPSPSRVCDHAMMRRWLIVLSTLLVGAASATTVGITAPRARAGDAPIGHIGDTLRVDTGSYVADITVSSVADTSFSRRLREVQKITNARIVTFIPETTRT